MIWIAQPARRHQLLAMPIHPGAGSGLSAAATWSAMGPATGLTGGDAAERQRCAEEGVVTGGGAGARNWRPSLPLSTSEDVAAQLRRALAIDPGGQVDGR
jgi:hypothetical protein